MNVKNWSFFSNDERKQQVKLHILDTFSLWGAIGLLWFSFISMIREHFPEYLQVTVEVVSREPITTSYVGPPTYATYGVDWWVIGLLVFVLWLGYEWPKQYFKKLTALCRLSGLAMLVGYIVVNFEKILDGFVRLAWFYLPYFNEYYKTNLYMGLATRNENSVVAFTAICMLLWWLIWVLAYGMKRRVLLVLFPVIALALELLVGLSPRENGLLYALFGAILLVTLGSISIAKKAVAVVCVGICVLLSGSLFEEQIEHLTTKEQKQELLAWQKGFNWNDFNLLEFLQIDMHFNWEQLDNSTPRYTGKIVLEIESDTYPVSTVYLKGFYGTKYEDGNWTYDDSVFRTACEEAGKSTEEVAEKIFQMPYERLLERFEDISTDLEIAYKILYTGTTGDVVYTPYETDYTSMDEEYTFMGDYLLKKAIWDRTIEVNGLNYGEYLANWLNVNEHIEPDFKDAEQLFINDLSDAYLQVPEGAEFLAEAGEKIRETIEQEGNSLSSVFEDNENYRRIQYAEAVGSYLAYQMSYSLKLDNLPAGADPVEYALTESHEGYCMHFASAATLLLREAGIPARYVSGYAVDTSAFKVDEDTGTYRAEVGDFMAHTWVEIYLDNIGWVPMEATTGSSLENLPTEEDMRRWESISEAYRATFEEQELESEETEQSTMNTEKETEQESEATESEETENATQTELEENPQGNVDGTKEENVFLQAGKVLGLLGCVAMLALLIRKVIRYAISRYESVLKREIEKNMTRKVVKRINRRLYGMLRAKAGTKGILKKWTDDEFLDALTSSFTSVTEEEWKQYMDIVKKNHYSREKISVEEMLFCYDCYKKADWLNKSLT